MVVPSGTVVETLVQVATVLAGTTLSAKVIVTASIGIARPKGEGLVHVVAFAGRLLICITVCIDASNATDGAMRPRFVAVAANAEAGVDEGSPVKVEEPITQRFVAVGVGTPIANVRPSRVVMPLVAKVHNLQATTGVAVGAAFTATLLGLRVRIFTVWSQTRVYGR